ncbi:MAG: hypothetical protein AB1631_02290 [Acidobacteriota bacterium]
MRIRPSVPLFALLLVISVSSQAFGQTEKGTISGVVTDQAGGVISLVAIEASRFETR